MNPMSQEDLEELENQVLELRQQVIEVQAALERHYQGFAKCDNPVLRELSQSVLNGTADGAEIVDFFLSPLGLNLEKLYWIMDGMSEDGREAYISSLFPSVN
jgi:hypothetical protein